MAVAVGLGWAAAGSPLTGHVIPRKWVVKAQTKVKSESHNDIENDPNNVNT